MKMLAVAFALLMSSAFAFAQEDLEEAPGASPMNTAPPPSSGELNEAVDQLSREQKSAPAPRPSAAKHAAPAPKHVAAKKVVKKATKAVKKSGKKAAKAKPGKKKKK